MAAALARGGLGSGGERPSEPIVPYVRAPEGIVPGRPLYFATAMPSAGGLGLGLLVESHLGRPIKVEGNPRHPASLGATDAFAQASVLTLYDPERLQAVTFGGAIRTWPDFLASCRAALGVQRARHGAGLRILTETVTSPTLGGQLRAVLDQYPEARWHQWEPARADAAGVAGVSAPAADQIPARWVQAVAHDLGRHRGRSLVVAGETQPAEVQALAHLTNAALGNVGHTVAYVPAAEVRSEDQLASLHELVDDMAAGRVELLVLLGGDPAFNAPADLPFAEAMAKVPLRVHLSLYANDTAARSHWVVPAAHYLESWGDVRAFDGTVTIVQPLIAPLYAGKSAHELLAVLVEGPARAGYDIVRARWQAERRAADFDDAWRSWLEAGVVPGTALATRYVLPRRAPAPAPARPGGERGLEVVFRPDPM